MMKETMVYVNRPIPLHKTPFFLRIFGFKKWRYHIRDNWVYANDIHEVYRQLNDIDELDDIL
jgi:hypothetical protein